MKEPTARILEFRDRNPRRNLPQAVSVKRGESNFVGAFGRALLAEYEKCYAAKGVEVNGYGIPDLVWISWAQDANGEEGRALEIIEESCPPPQIRLTSFEMKLKDWRRGFVQAYRYSYFTDRAILVLPDKLAKQVSVELPKFKDALIGLWGFDKQHGIIREHFTPRSSGRARGPLKGKITNRFLSRLKNQSSA